MGVTSLSQENSEFLREYASAMNLTREFNVSPITGLPDESFNLRDDTIEFSDHSGLRNGVNYLSTCEIRGSKPRQGIHAPSFQIRGVIEGFYGAPWTHRQRMKLLKFMAFRNMNTFVLAPKDDPWQRFNWRVGYSEEFLQEVSELVSLAKKIKIEISVCLSPGLTIAYSSIDDREALVHKYNQLARIGIRTFGLLLDDIPSEVQHEEDKKKFATISQAHAHLANSIYAELLGSCEAAKLYVCPFQYHGRGSEPYISELGRSLNGDLELMWTGREICSEYLDTEDAEAFKRFTSKAPLYWDNFPVNDVAMTHQLHIGPIVKRSMDLGRHSRGLFTNPMELFEASLLPIHTIADYLWDSESYAPEDSWRRAISDCISDPRDAEAFEHFASHCFESCLAVDPAPNLGSLLDEVRFAYRTGNVAQAVLLLERYVEKIELHFGRLIGSDFSWPEVVAEIKPWLDKYRELSNHLSLMAKALIESSWRDGQIQVPEQARREIENARRNIINDPKRFGGDYLHMAMAELVVEAR